MISKKESKCRKKYFAEAHIKKDVQSELDTVIKNSPFTYKGLLKQFRLQKAVEKQAKINSVPCKVYFDGEEVSGIYKFDSNDLELKAGEQIIAFPKATIEFKLKGIEFKLEGAAKKYVQKNQ